MSYKFQRHGTWLKVYYEDVKKTVAENLANRRLPTTISVKWLSVYVAKKLDVKRNERHWKFHKFVDFALRELTHYGPANIDGVLVNNDNNKWLSHIYLVHCLKEEPATKKEQPL